MSGDSGAADERSPRWTVVVHEGREAMVSATPAWEECLRACPEALVFSRPAWARAWLEVYGRHGAACIVEVTCGGRPMAVFPFQTTVVPLLGLRRLEFLGGAPPTWAQWALSPKPLGQVIYADGVIVPGQEADVLATLRDWLDDAAGRWDVVQLNCVPVDSALARQLWPLGPSWRCVGTSQVKHRIDLSSGWDDWTATISKRQRRHLNYEPHALTRAAGAPLELDEVRGLGVLGAMEEYLELTRLRWRAVRRPGLSVGDVALYRQLAGQGDSGMVFYRLIAGERLLACQFGFDNGGRYLIYGLSFDPSFERESPSQVLMQMVIRRCFDDGHAEVDLGALRQVERWTSDTRSRVHLTAEARRPLARARLATFGGALASVQSLQASTAGARLRSELARRAGGPSAPLTPVTVRPAERRAEAAARSGPANDDAQVTVIVPTHNSAQRLACCLASLRRQRVACRIIVVDNFSTDATVEVASGLADQVLRAGPERSAQRNTGARLATTKYLGFIDSDMVVGEGVVEEAINALDGSAGAVIVPERTVGLGFWANVRQFERSFYVGSGTVEAARFFRRTVFEAAGGFDESFTGGEDWDLHLRVSKLAPVARTKSAIDHDESSLGYWESCAKKAYYAPGLRVFAAKHGRQALTAAVFDRPYLRRPWTLAYPHPLLGAGLVALKAGELASVGASLARTRYR